jgi:hypothetical protein
MASHIEEISYTWKCPACRVENTVHHKFNNNDRLPLGPVLHYCKHCKKPWPGSFPPFGYFYSQKIDGLNFTGNEYLVNLKLRQEILNDFKERREKIKTRCFGLINYTGLSPDEQKQFDLIQHNIAIFNERVKSDLLTDEENAWILHKSSAFENEGGRAK